MPRIEGAMFAGSMEARHLEYQRLDARHLPFFAALGTLDAGSPDWAAAKAGLVTLRLVDSWTAQGRCVLSVDSWGRRAVEAAIDELPPADTERHLLANIVSATMRVAEPTIARIAAPLLAYAYALQVRAAWALAADVYEVVVDGCSHTPWGRSSGDPGAAATAAVRLGACYRMLGDRERSDEAYRTGQSIAAASADTYNVLRGQLGLAQLTIDRGNLPEAESRLDALILAAQGDRLTDIRGRARHERAHVAHRRGQYALAVELAYDAWVEVSDPDEGDRVLVGLAAALVELGECDAARDANLVLASRAREAYTRWVATVNLIEIAYLDRREVDFVRHRRALENVPLPPALAAYFHYYLARGYQVFGQPQRARAELKDAIRIAEAHKLNELLVQTEAELDRLNTDSLARLPVRLGAGLPSMTRVASAIRNVREAAGIAG